MALGFQLVIDCRDPDRLARFWVAALGYRLEPPPDGFASWDDYYRDIGVPEELFGHGADRIGDPEGRGPAIWFQVVPEAKTIKNRLHVDIHAGGDRSVPLATRRERVDAAARRLVELGATLREEPDDDEEPSEEMDGYAVGLRDPEGNEFDIN
jgi:Glyoxalase-like domain